MAIILASNSPRRKELLSLANVNFKVIPSKCDEILNEDLDIGKRIEDVAYQKAKEVFDNNPKDIVIGADTVVVINKKILGKPKNEEDAKKMINLLQGKKHFVITGVTIISNDNVEKFHVTTEVKFASMTSDEIAEYVKNKKIYDKAGAYAIQEEAIKYIESINGSYSNVVGLPISEVMKHLKKYL